MIVAITGSHSTGKSTIVDFVKDNPKFVSLNSVTRSTITDKERKIDGIDNLDNAQIKIMNNIISGVDDIVQMNKQDPSKIYLMDRCVFDFIAYSRSFYKQGNLSKEVLNEIESKCTNLYKHIDLFVYLPIEFDIVDDGVRSLDNNLRKNVDNEIKDLLKCNNINYITLKGNVNERIESLQNAINTVLNH